MRMSSRSHRSAMAWQRIAQLGAISDFVDDDAELAADRIRHLDGQQVERGGDRVAGAQAAHEHIQRDRELILHLLRMRVARSCSTKQRDEQAE